MTRLLAVDPARQRNQVSASFFVLTVAFGLAQVWACRYEMTPDGMDYLDIARELAAGRFSAVANGYWGTLISVLLAPIFRFHPSPERELLLADAIGIFILVLAFFSFQFFLHSWLDLRPAEPATVVSPPEWALSALGYSLFLWSSLTMIGVDGVGPDLLVTVFVYLAAGILMRLQPTASPLNFAAFGLTLGLGYWAKAIMFPVGLVFLAVAILRVRVWRKNLLSVVVFAVVAAPLVLMLSVPRGRFTFGDSGKLNYSSFVSPGGRVINWQGDPVASGVPVHPTRQIADHPPIYEFNGPVPGTYPPSYDPSYWNEGRKTPFSLRQQLKVFLAHIPPVFELLFLAQPSLTAGFLFLFLWNRAGFFNRLARSWELWTISLAIIGLYMLLHFESRFVGAFVVVIWLSVFLALRVPAHEDSQRIAALSIVALVAIMLLSFVSNTAKKIRNGCPESALSQIKLAHQLPIPPGTNIAVVGLGNFSYWAHFAQLRIVADIMAPDESLLWEMSEEQRQTVYTAFRKTGAKWIIGQPPACVANLPDTRWQRIGTTAYYLYPLAP